MLCVKEWVARAVDVDHVGGLVRQQLIFDVDKCREAPPAPFDNDAAGAAGERICAAFGFTPPAGVCGNKTSRAFPTGAPGGNLPPKTLMPRGSPGYEVFRVWVHWADW